MQSNRPNAMASMSMNDLIHLPMSSISQDLGSPTSLGVLLPKQHSRSAMPPGLHTFDQTVVDVDTVIGAEVSGSRNHSARSAVPSIPDAIDLGDLQLKLERSLATDLAKLRETVDVTKCLLADFIWLHQNDKSEPHASAKEFQHGSHETISAILRSQQNIEAHLSKTQLVEAGARDGDSTSLSACLKTMESLLAKQEERYREGFDSLMAPNVDKICQAIEQALLLAPARPQSDPSAVLRAARSRDNFEVQVERASETSEKIVIHPGRQAHHDQSKSENAAPAQTTYPQQVKCRIHIEKRFAIEEARVSQDVVAYLKMHNLMPVWLEKLFVFFHRCRTRKAEQGRRPSTQSSDPIPEEEEEATCYRRYENFIAGTNFGLFSFMMIGLNVFWMGYTTNSQMKDFLRGRGNVDHDELGESFHNHVDAAFAIYFAVECVLRFVAERPGVFFCGENARFNVLDVVVVCFSFFQIVFHSINVSYLRTIRILRVMRLLRAVRLLRMFADFRAILVMVMSSLPLLVWTGLLISLWMFIMSVALMEMVVTGANLKDEHSRDMVNKYYGSLGTTMYTLLQIATNGELWGKISREMGNDLQFVQTLLFIFVAPVLFMLFPVIYGYYCLKVFDLQRVDTFLAMHRREDEANRFLSDLRDIFSMVNVPLDSEITVDGLHTLFKKHPELKFFLETAGISALPEELMSLFNANSGTPTSEDGLTMREFMFGCQWLKLAGQSVETILMGMQLADMRAEGRLSRYDVSRGFEVLTALTRARQLPKDVRRSSSGGQGTKSINIA